MKLLNTVHLSVFAKEEDDFEAIKKAFLTLIPFDIVSEKLALDIVDALGFEKTIRIISLTLSKEKHTNAFLKDFTTRLSDEQKQVLLKQFYSRCDSEFNFFIRLDKQGLLRGEYILTDGGDCFHIRMNLACYPKNLDSARAVVEKILA